MARFPVFIEMGDRKVTVIGAGTVATRRILVLLEYGARITVIAPKASDEITALSKKGALNLLEEPYGDDDGPRRGAQLKIIGESGLVISATDSPACDLLVHEDCRRLGIPVNIASDRSLCDFYFPGTARGAGVTAAVITDKADHHLAAKAAHEIQRLLKELED